MGGRRQVLGLALVGALAGPACNLSTDGLSQVTTSTGVEEEPGVSRSGQDAAVARPLARPDAGGAETVAVNTISDAGPASPGPAPDAFAAPPVSDAGPDQAPPPDAAVSPDVGLPPPPDASVACPRGDPALVLCLAFEGQVVDESPGALAVDVRQVGFAPGLDGHAVALGEQSAISVAQKLALFDEPNKTLEAWVRPDRLPGVGQRAGVIDRDGHFGLFVLPGGDVTCSNGGVHVTAPAAVAAGSWTSLACTLTAARLALWIDGVSPASAAVGLRLPGSLWASVSVGSNNPAGDHFIGQLDNVRIWTRVRAPDEICQAAHTCVLSVARR
jgi:hypothetical protein